jgi:SRSO17 transposase
MMTSPSSPPGAQAGTAIETLVAVEGHRWAIDDSFETAKSEFGLDRRAPERLESSRHATSRDSSL